MLYKIVKRCFDFILSLLLSIITFPFFLIIAILIKFDSKGPVFFIHNRVGKNGKRLPLLKFRTMVDGAEDMIKDFSPEQKKEWEENYKLEHDPRITKVGRFLRKTSIDNKSKVLSVVPGLTGWWACNGRSNVSYEERMQLELYYVDHASIGLDIKIMFKTIGVVFTHEGAV